MSFVPSSKFQWGLKIVVMAVAYYATAALSFSLKIEGATFIPYWPPSGVAFALAILFGRSVWPGIFIGTLLANSLGQWYDPQQNILTILGIASFVAIGNVVEMLVGLFLLKHWTKVAYPFHSTRNAFRFVFIAIIMSLIGALIGLIGQLVFTEMSASNYLRASFSWWMESAVGLLIFTPLLLSFAQRPKAIFTKVLFKELTIFAGIIVFIMLLLQIPSIRSAIIQGLPFLVLPFLLWLSFRFGLATVSACLFSVSLVAIYFTSKLQGPFVLATPSDSSLLLQLFFGVLCIAVIVLSATVYERATAQDEVMRLNHNLEDLVAQRTLALNEEIKIRLAAEKELQHINQELNKKNTELDNFVYSVSHDLRAPIASLKGLMNLLKKESEKVNLNLYLDKMISSVQQQDNFIQDILDQSRNSRLEVKREEVYFKPLLEEAFEQLRFALAPDQRIEKTIDVDQQEPFYSDRWRLKIIFNNIIANAIRYHRGLNTRIEIKIKINAHRAYLTIDDNGIGIGPEHLEKVYDMFYRATEHGAGSGLGLYIVKETVTKLHGVIRLTSALGVGTKIELEIPETK